MGTWKKSKKYAYGKAQKNTNTGAPNLALKGWVRLNGEFIELIKKNVVTSETFFDFALWREDVGYSIAIQEQWKPSEEGVTEVPAKVDYQKELNDEIPF